MMEITQSDYAMALIGVGGTMLGVLLGAVVGYQFSKRLAVTAEKRRAAYKVHEAFRDELLALEPGADKVENLRNLLKGSFEKHRAAVYDFSFYLTPTQRNAFLRDWRKYYQHDTAKNVEVPFFEKYSIRGKKFAESNEIKKLARTRIERVLSHANYTSA